LRFALISFSSMTPDVIRLTQLPDSRLWFSRPVTDRV
jgi:hypothetical protein